MRLAPAAALLAAALLAPVGARAARGAEPAGEPPDARYARAERLLRAGEIEKAYEIYESLVKSDPRRWEERAGRRMEEIRRLAAERGSAKERAGRLRRAAAAAAAAGQAGELVPWLLLRAAGELLAGGFREEAAAGAAEVIAKHAGSRFAAGAGLLLARAQSALGRTDEAAAAYRAALAAAGATRAERAAAWRELCELLAAAGRREELLAALAELAGRGAEEPGAAEGLERLVALAQADLKLAPRVRAALESAAERWPPSAFRPEWLLAAARIAEYLERDYPRAERLYRLVLQRHPEACVDPETVAAGGGAGDAGRKVLLGSLARVAAKRAGTLKPLAAPAAAERGAGPEKALAAVLAALAAADPEAAAAAACGRLAEEVRAGRLELWRFAFSDFRVLSSAPAGENAAEVEYEVSGELGVTRTLRRKARAETDGKAWRISSLGL